MENLVKLEMLDLQDLKDREAQRCVLSISKNSHSAFFCYHRVLKERLD